MSAPAYVAPVLVDLFARAGASDKDRPAWLRQRRGGLTATEIRDLWIGAISEQRLIDQKLERIPESGDLNRVPVIGWGNAREVAIGEVMRGEGFEPESRVFHHPDNSRHLASPDSIAVTWDEDLWVGEYKTAEGDLPPGSPELAKKGYEIQVQWVMYVIGANRCRFVVEERLTTQHRTIGGHGFLPGDLHRHWIERDDELIAQLIERADQFLEELDRQALEGAPEVDEEIDTHAFNYHRGLTAEKEGRELKETAYSALLKAKKSQRSENYQVTYSPGKPGAVTTVAETDFEKAKRARGGKALFAALQEAQDAVRDAQAAWDAHCERFTKQVEVVGKGSGARVTVTPVKQKEKAA